MFYLPAVFIQACFLYTLIRQQMGLVLLDLYDFQVNHAFSLTFVHIFLITAVVGVACCK